VRAVAGGAAAFEQARDRRLALAVRLLISPGSSVTAAASSGRLRSRGWRSPELFQARVQSLILFSGNSPSRIIRRLAGEAATA